MRRTLTTAAVLSVGAVLGALLSIAAALANYGISNGRVLEVSILLAAATMATAVIVAATSRFIR